jgi:hypothetical protein
MGFWIWGLEFGVYDLGFKVSDFKNLGFRVSGFKI